MYVYVCACICVCTHSQAARDEEAAAWLHDCLASGPSESQSPAEDRFASFQASQRLSAELCWPRTLPAAAETGKQSLWVVAAHAAQSAALPVKWPGQLQRHVCQAWHPGPWLQHPSRLGLGRKRSSTVENWLTSVILHRTHSCGHASKFSESRTWLGAVAQFLGRLCTWDPLLMCSTEKVEEGSQPNKCGWGNEQEATVVWSYWLYL